MRPPSPLALLLALVCSMPAFVGGRRRHDGTDDAMGRAWCCW